MKNRVRELRTALELSQGGLGEQLGVSRQTVKALFALEAEDER